MRSYSRNIVSVDKNSLKHNYSTLQEHIGHDKKLLAMVKADAYGHGMIESAKAFYEAGCRTFGVAEVGEGVALRKAGQDGEILIFLGFEHQYAHLFFDYDLKPVVFSEEDISLLNELAQQREQTLDIHLKVDTGMSRLGIFPEEVERFVELCKEMTHLNLSGLVSHFASSDVESSTATVDALTRFENIREVTTTSGIEYHIANSGGVLNYPASHYSFSRAGISLYGYYPDGSSGESLDLKRKLKPAMSFTTSIVQIKNVPANTGISYGHTYVTDKQTKIAVLPVGYEDGLSRALSNNGFVLVKGRKASIIGRVCMNLCMIDVTGIDDVKTGDEVTILGKQGEETISADDIGSLCNTISYEILCMFGNNNHRKYL